MKKKVIIGIILSIIWMIVIFLFSSKSSLELDLKNNFIVKTIINIIDKDFDMHTIDEKNEIISNVSFYVSKTAHFIEYGILSIFLFFAFAFIKKYSLRYFFMLIISFLYALSDEYHQTFSQGRTPRLQDVLIDTLGALTFILIIEFVLTIYRYKKLRSIYD